MQSTRAWTWGEAWAGSQTPCLAVSPPETLPARTALLFSNRIPPLCTLPQVHYLDEPCSDYLAAAVEAALQVHRQELPGDILIFLTGQDECQAAVRLLEEESQKSGHRSGQLSLQVRGQALGDVFGERWGVPAEWAGMLEP